MKLSTLPGAAAVPSHESGPCSRKTFGFSMVELLVVISLVSSLMALLMPALQSSRTTANLIRSGAQLRDLQFSLHRYIADNQSKTPLVDFPHSNNINSLTTTFPVQTFTDTTTFRGRRFSGICPM